MTISNEMAEVSRGLVHEGFSVMRWPGGLLRIDRPDMDEPVFASEQLSDPLEVKGVLARLRRKTRH
jgi:hypothetical protein